MFWWGEDFISLREIIMEKIDRFIYIKIKNCRLKINKKLKGKRKIFVMDVIEKLIFLIWWEGM